MAPKKKSNSSKASADKAKRIAALQEELETVQGQLNDHYVGEQFLDFTANTLNAVSKEFGKLTTVESMYNRSGQVMQFFEDKIKRANEMGHKYTVEPSAPPLEEEEQETQNTEGGSMPAEAKKDTSNSTDEQPGGSKE